MIIFPAIDLYQGEAVRLYQGDYKQKTVYDAHPLNTAKRFEEAGATHIHIVDLEGARDGGTPNMAVVRQIIENTSLVAEVGGGVRDMRTIERYLSAGASRVILGTAAVTMPGFVKEAVAAFGDKIAVGVDIKDGQVAVKGWTQKSGYDYLEFCDKMQAEGVATLVCTDISRDGAMRGANRALYRALTEALGMNVIASGGVSTLQDVQALAEMGLYGAIIGKAYYTGAIRLEDALKIAGGLCE